MSDRPITTTLAAPGLVGGRPIVGERRRSLRASGFAVTFAATAAACRRSGSPARRRLPPATRCGRLRSSTPSACATTASRTTPTRRSSRTAASRSPLPSTSRPPATRRWRRPKRHASTSSKSRPARHRSRRLHAGRRHTERIESGWRVGVGQDRARRRLPVCRWQRVRLLGTPGRPDQGRVLPRRRRRLLRRRRRAPSPASTARSDFYDWSISGEDPAVPGAGSSTSTGPTTPSPTTRSSTWPRAPGTWISATSPVSTRPS